jgi:hypothetical protein
LSVMFSPDGKLLASGDRNDCIILWELDGQKQRWALFDPETLEDQVKLRAYDQRDLVGTGVCTCNTIWLQAESALPKGAACVCNTITVGPVEDDAQSQTVSARTMAGKVCTCDKVCTCHTICTCNAVSRGGGGGGGGRTCTCDKIHYWYPT